MSNPFDDNNPFADPSIQNVTKSTQQTQNSLDDYNPFAHTNVTRQPAIIQTTTTQQPTTSNPPAASSSSSSSPPPPQYTQTSAQNINIDSIRRQEEELARKAAELDRKEQALRNQQTNNGGAKVNNFPPLPSWCPFGIKPCFYQDINVEIPVDFQKWVRILFYLWMFHGCTLFFNVIGALVVFIATKEGISFGFSILYFVLFTPCSYVCWFRPAYKAFRSDSSFNFMVFFFIFFCQIIVNCIEAIGIEDSGFCGVILMAKIFSKSGVSNIVAGVFVLLITLCFLIIAVTDIIVLIKIHRMYRTTGASFEQAQREFASNVLSNKNVQNAAVTVITEGAKQTANNYASNSTTPGRF